MAGGDGSQAVVASVAAELGLPYACIPAGTRNHFALDLGVDRDDVVGALEAFVDGGERTVDLAEVNGRVFVNNVSLGLYAVAVQRDGYRDAKLRTLLDTVPDALGPEGDGLDMHWTGPGGTSHQSGAAVLVSNNKYRLGRALGSGTRPRIDDGLLGITVFGAAKGRGETGRSIQRPLARVVGAGLRGRLRTAPSPPASTARRSSSSLRSIFRIRPGALCVRIARKHPGASPSAMAPEGALAGVAELARIATGRHRKSAPSTKEGPAWT